MIHNREKSTREKKNINKQTKQQGRGTVKKKGGRTYTSTSLNIYESTVLIEQIVWSALLSNSVYRSTLHNLFIILQLHLPCPYAHPTQTSPPHHQNQVSHSAGAKHSQVLPSSIQSLLCLSATSWSMFDLAPTTSTLRIMLNLGK